MRIIQGDLSGSQVTVDTSQAELEVHARLLVVKRFQLPKDMHSIELLSNKTYHSFEQWLIMVVLSLTVVGLLVAIPMYILGKKQLFTVRFTPKHDSIFIVEGNKDDWKLLERYLK